MIQASGGYRSLTLFLLSSLFAAQLKEFQQKSSPTSVGGEKGGGGGGAGAKKKRKVKGGSQPDASTDRNSPDNVSHYPFLSDCLFICQPLCPFCLLAAVYALLYLSVSLSCVVTLLFIPL